MRTGMPVIITVLLYVFEIAWLVGVLALLIWQAVVGQRRIDQMLRAQIEQTARAQENNRISAHAAEMLADVITKDRNQRERESTHAVPPTEPE